METYPATNVFDLLRLLGNLIDKFLQNSRRFNAKVVLTNCLKGLTINYKSENLILDFLLKKVLLVSGRDLSAHILKEAPSSQGYIEGTLKKRILKGARTCPGKDLILFVCKSAIAILLEQQKLRVSSTKLAQKCLLLYFPEKDIHFYTQFNH